MTAASYHQLRHALEKWVTLDDNQWQTLQTLFRHREVKPKTRLITPGDMTHELLFVSRGLLRFYYISEQGQEANKAFITENMFAGPLAAYALNLPVIYGVQALEPTTLLVAQYREFVTLFDQDPVFERLGRKLAEWLLTRKEIRARSLLLKQAKDRYLEFIEHHPQLIYRIPQYHIASYLGITEVSLSRLRRNLTSEM